MFCGAILRGYSSSIMRTNYAGIVSVRKNHYSVKNMPVPSSKNNSEIDKELHSLDPVRLEFHSKQDREGNIDLIIACLGLAVLGVIYKVRSSSV